jgi:uncharacterized RDD family membrane protein YckC
MNTVGIGTRTLSFLIDTLLVFILAYFTNKFFSWLTYYYFFKPVQFGYIFFSVLFFYYFISELFTKRSIGKYCSFSKVVTLDNKKPSVVQIFIRSIVRITIIDMFFIPFLDVTLHDYASKTKVVEV